MVHLADSGAALDAHASLALRRLAEERAAELDAVFDSVAAPIMVIDAAGIITRVNPAFVRHFGLIEKWIGLSIADRLREAHVETGEGQPLEPPKSVGIRALAGETVQDMLQQTRLPDGSYRYVSTSAAPIRTGAGIVGAAIVFWDVTDRVLAEQALRDADQRKNDFLAVLSHELRNPLAPIRSSVYILQKAPPGGEIARRAVATIDRQVSQLTHLVDDLLDLTRVTRGKIQLRRERVNLTDLVQRALDDHRTVFTKNGVHLEPVLPPDPLWVLGDPTRLTQIVGNLLHNAAKFTPTDGRAAVTLEPGPSGSEAVLTVADTGAGIAPEVLPHVFEAFIQADSTLDRSQGGLGLGLALVRGLVELHGGHVEAKSDGTGTGAEFVVRLPIELHVAEGGSGPASQSAVSLRASRRVLILDTKVDAADSLRDLLELRGHTVAVAYALPAAIERAHAFRPEVVLCDMALGEGSASAMSQALRSCSDLTAATLVALASMPGSDDPSAADRAGFDVVLLKPASLRAIERAIEAPRLAP